MHIKKTFSVLIALIYLCTYLAFPPISSAAEFNPNFIISDNDLNDYTSMNLGAIQTFLENKNGVMLNPISQNQFAFTEVAAIPQVYFILRNIGDRINQKSVIDNGWGIGRPVQLNMNITWLVLKISH